MNLRLNAVGLFVKDHRMVRMGATPIVAPKTYPWGLRSSFVADPEGNLIEIATWKR